MPLGLGRNKNVGLRDFSRFDICCHRGASVFHKHISHTFLKLDRSCDLKHCRDKSLDLSSFRIPTKNPIFQHSIFNKSGFLKFKVINFCKVHLPLHLFPNVFILFAKSLLIVFIEVNDKHRVCPWSVIAQNTECIRLYGISQLRCDIMPTLRMSSFKSSKREISLFASCQRGRFSAS